VSSSRLKATDSADLTRFEFFLPNLKIAKALGLDFPPTLRALADEMLEEELALR
jgi:hypothetical protein